MPEAAYTLTPIAHIRSEFREKFGIPRQSGLVDALRAQVVFTPPFRNADALRGLEDYSHLWLIWQFSRVVAAGADGANWSPTVRAAPPGRQCAHRGVLPRAARTGPTRWGFPACGWWACSRTAPKARC